MTSTTIVRAFQTISERDESIATIKLIVVPDFISSFSMMIEVAIGGYAQRHAQ
jgi:hypothetical protein